MRAPQILLALALVSFVLPFFALVREGRVVLSFSGTELLLGTTFQPGSPFARLGHIGSEHTAVLAGLAIAAALALSFVHSRALRLRGFAFALAATILLFFLRTRFAALLRVLVPGAEVREASGYYVALVCTIAGAVLLATSWLRERAA